MASKMCTYEKLCSDKAAIVTSITSIAISLICVIIVATSNQRSTVEQGHEPLATNTSFEWCLPCQVLANGSSLEIMDKTMIGTVQHCCAHNSEQATRLLELMVSTSKPEADIKFEVSTFALSRASAHKQLTLTTFRSFDEPVFQDNMQLEFDPGPGDALIDHARNITVMKHVMVVEIPGHYYVYSGIFFKPDSSNPCKALEKQIWDHNIVLIRGRDTSGVIFNTTYTCCDECVEHKKTSYAGGLFHLLENDRLYVEVSSDGVISFRKEGSYFGLFLLE